MYSLPSFPLFFSTTVSSCPKECEDNEAKDLPAVVWAHCPVVLLLTDSYQLVPVVQAGPKYLLNCFLPCNP